MSSLNLKLILKALKLNESTISMVLGALVIVFVGVLVINYFKGREAGTTLPGGVNTETQGNLSLPRTHTVAKGETLWKIAEIYYQSGYNWVDIAKENNLTNAGSIEVGQVLTIPNVTPKKATVTTTNVQAAESTIGGSTYQVVRGDNLWDIAVRAYGDGYKWVEIAKENKLVNPNLIHAGNILILPR